MAADATTSNRIPPGKRVVILGLARQGLALARYWSAAGASVVISDMAAAEKLQSEVEQLGDLPVELALGGHPLALLDGCGLLCLSGGVPPQLEIVQAAIAQNIPLTNDSLLTLQLAAQRGLGPALAITGSSGKTTTTTLAGKMLAAAGKTVHVGGNIGTPLVDRLDEVQPGQPLVIELSSFQLELFTASWAWGRVTSIGPQVGALLNVTPNHLDRHSGMAAYADAKLNLIRSMPTGATLVVNADDPVTQRLTKDTLEVLPLPRSWNLDGMLAAAAADVAARLQVITFSRLQPLRRGAWFEADVLFYEGDVICKRSELKLRGDHNVSNMLAAAAIAGAAGASTAAMREVARSFAGVPHRLEVVSEQNGVIWINDSIATSPERALAGLRSFETSHNAMILLAGGKDKNLPWEHLADEILHRVNYLICFGHSGPMIVETVRERAQYLRKAAPACAVVQRLDDAVELAVRVAAPGTVVLLSPGGTSYDAYRDFEQRGEHFRTLVRAVTHAER